MLLARICTFFSGVLVGHDQFGNKYYTDRKNKRRWVLYKGIDEASKVPAEWHGWLHYTHERPLVSNELSWQKHHLPNLTGTKYRYLPAAHNLRGAERKPVPLHYQPWQP